MVARTAMLACICLAAMPVGSSAAGARSARVAPLRLVVHRLVHGSGLASVSCGSTVSCMALDKRGRAYHWNGRHWSPATTVTDVASGPGGIAVSCYAGNACIADASRGSVISSWNGHVWNSTTLADANGLESVGCARSGFCATVDGIGNSFAYEQGGWARVAGDWGSVTAISCVWSSFCVSTSASGISMWNGSRWTLPDNFNAAPSFTGVSCVSASFCLAVDNSGGTRFWNGSRWSAAQTFDRGRPTATTLGPEPTAVSCATSSFCMVVDNRGAMLEWQRGVWTRVRGRGAYAFSAVSCPSTTLCVATDSGGEVLIAHR